MSGSNLLDNALSRLNMGSGVDNLTSATSGSLANVSTRMLGLAAKPQVTEQVVGNAYNNQQSSQDSYIDQIEQGLPYLQQKEAEIRKREEKYADSWVSDANLESDNWLIKGGANIANAAIGAAGSIANIIPQGEGLLNNLGQQSILSGIPDDIKDIDARRKATTAKSRLDYASEIASINNRIKYDGTLTPEDLRELNDRKVALDQKLNLKAPTEAELAKLKGKDARGNTWAELFEASDEVGKSAFDPNSKWHPRNWSNDKAKREFEAITQANHKDGQGFMDRVLNNFGTVVTEKPGIILDTLADSAAYMIPQVRVAAALGLGAETYDTTTDNIRERENKHDLSVSDQVAAIGLSAANAGLGYLQGRVEGSALVGNLGANASRVTGRVADSVAGAVNKASGATIGKAGIVGKGAHLAGSALNTALAKATPVAGRVGIATGVEGAVEGTQSIIEQFAENARVNWDDVADSVTLGMAAGAGISTPGAVVKTGIDTVSGMMTDKAVKATGGTTPTEDLVNPNHASYDPTAVVRRATTQFTGSNAPNLSEEDVLKSKSEVDQAYTSANALLDSTQRIYDRLDKRDGIANAVSQLQAIVDKTTADMQAQGATPEEIQEKVKGVVGQLGMAKADLEAVDNALNDRETFEKMHKANVDRVAEVSKAYEQFDKTYTAFTNKRNQATQTEEAVDNQPKTPVDEANDLLGAPSFETVNRMVELARDESIDQKTRDSLRVVSEALIAENKAKSMAQVSGDVYKGEPERYLGTSTYINQFTKAVKDGDITKQQHLYGSLSRFNTSMSTKAEAAEEALAEANRRRAENPTGSAKSAVVKIVRESNGTWRTDINEPVNAKRFSRNNGLQIWPTKSDGTGGSGNLVKAIRENADAVSKAMNIVTDMRPENSKKDPMDYETYLSDFDLAMDQMNADERATNRDTSFRDNDPNAKVVEDQDASVQPVSEAPVVEQQQQQQAPIDEAPEFEQDPFDIGVQDPSDYDVPSDLNVPNTDLGEQALPNPNITPIPKEIAESALSAMPNGSDFEVAPVMGGYVIQPKAKAETKPTPKPKAKAKPKDTGPKDAVKPTAEPKPTVVEESETYVEELVDGDVVEETNTASETLANGNVDASPLGAISVLDTKGLSYKEAIKQENAKEDPKLINKVKTGFVQRVKAGVGVNSPLVLTKDFLSNFVNNNGLSDPEIAQLIVDNSNIKYPTERQVDQVRNFMYFADFFKGAISSVLQAKSNPAYHYESVVDYLYTYDNSGKPVLDENIMTAMALGAYDWIGSNSSNILGTSQDIANKLWSSEAKVLPAEAYTLMNGVGEYRNEAAKAIGSKAMSALQLRKLKDSDRNLNSKLTNALGILTIAALEDAGYVQRVEVSRKDMNELREMIQELNGEDAPIDAMPKYKNSKDSSTITFVRPAVQLKGTPDNRTMVTDTLGRPLLNNNVKLIHEASKQASSVLPAVFGFTSSMKAPSHEPITTVPNSFDKLGSRTSKFQREVVTKMQSRPYGISNGMMDSLTAFLDNAPDKLNKLLSLQNPSEVLAIVEESVKSKNAEVVTSIENLQKTYADFKDQGIYISNTVWSNMRSGNDTYFNPQANRIHRAFSSLESDNIELSTKEDGLFVEGSDSGELTHYGAFMRSLGYRMEEAENMVDVEGELAKNPKADWLPVFERYITSDEVTDAVNAYSRIRDGKAKSNDYDTVADLVGTWGNGADGLSVLNALADLYSARAKGEPTFRSRITGESDGSNNGPAFTQLFLGTINKEILNAVGVYTLEDVKNGVQNLVQSIKKGGLDMYRQLAKVKERYMLDALEEVNEAGVKYDDLLLASKERTLEPNERSKLKEYKGLMELGNVLNLINEVDGNFTSRSGAKRELVPFNYGAGFKAILRGGSKAFIEEVTKKYNKAYMNKDGSSADLLTKQLNGIISYYNKMNGTQVPLINPANMRTREASLQPNQVSALRKSEEALRGNMSKSALEEMLGDYINARTQITAVSNVGYRLFEPLYNTVMAQAIKEYRANNPEALRTKEDLTTALHEKVMNNIRPFMPKLDTAMGLKNTEFNSSAIPMMTLNTSWSSPDMVDINDQVRVPYINNNPLTISKRSLERNYTYTPKDPLKSISTDIEFTTLDAPGVSPQAKYIQSHDAATNFTVIDKYSVQNYHDASPANPLLLDEMAQYQNKAFVDVLTMSNMGEAFLNGLLAPLRAYAKGVVSYNQENAKTFNASIAGLRSKFMIDEQVPPRGVVHQVATTLLSRDMAKYNNFLHLYGSFNQYATEGGEHVLTEKDRAMIVQRQGDFVDRAKKLTATIDRIFDDIEKNFKVQKGSAPKPKGPIVSQVKPKDPNADITSKMTPVEKDLFNYRDTLKDPVRLMDYVKYNAKSQLTKDSAIGKFTGVYLNLLNLAKGSLAGIEVNIFSDVETNLANKALDYDKAVAKGTSAWYVQRNGKRQINLRLGYDGSISIREIVHELVHAATAEALEQVRTSIANGTVKDDFDGNKLAVNAYENLQEIYKLAKAQLFNSDMTKLTKYGFKNLDEFIAVGMTYGDFAKLLDGVYVTGKLPHDNTGASNKNSVLRKVATNVVNLFRGVFGKPTPPNDGGKNIKEVTALEALMINSTKFIEATNKGFNYGTEVGFLGAPSTQAVNDLATMDARDVLKALPSTGDVELDAHLDKVTDSITARVLSRMPKDYKGKGRYSPENVINNALESGKAPYITDALKAGFAMSDREQFVVESAEVALIETLKDKSLSEIHKDLEKVYASAESKITPKDLVKGKDWDNATSEQKREAQAKYDYLFNPNDPNNLARFMALVLGNQEVAKLADFNYKVSSKGADNKDGNDYFAKAYNHLEFALDYVADKVLGSTTRNTKGRINAIATKFVDIDGKSRNKVLTAVEVGTGYLDKKANDLVKGAADKVSRFASGFNPETTAGRILRNTTVATLSGEPMKAFDVIGDAINKENPNQTLGFLGELNKEIGKVSEEAIVAEQLITLQKKHENASHDLRSKIKEDLISLFKDGGKHLTKPVREAVTNGLLRNDIQALGVSYSMGQIHKLVGDSKYLSSQIIAKSKGVAPHHVARAKILAWYMVGNSGNKMLAHNAYAIATDAGLGLMNKNVSDDYIQQIDELTSLYALQYTDAETKQTLNKLMDQEKSKDGYGGVEAVLKSHKGLVNDSRNHLFKDTEMHMTKGYMPEVTNGSRKVEMAYSPADVDRLKTAMYTNMGEVTLDSADPSTFKPVMFYTEDAATQSYVSGAIPLYSNGSKGHKPDIFPEELADIVNNARNELRSLDASFDPRVNDTTSMSPIYDANGNITGMRYEMSAHKRNTLLQRNNDFSDLIGAFNAIGYTKLANKSQVDTVVKALHQSYKQASVNDMSKMVYVGYDSSDPKAYDAWSRLSSETKDKVKEVWGEYGMWVANDAFLTIFGHPKLSLMTSPFDKDVSARNMAEEVYVAAMQGIFGDNARIAGARAERMWQEMVKLTKNFVVIRNVSTAVMNITSNTFLLAAHGVPLADIVESTRVSIKGGMQYRKDNAMLVKLRNRQRAGIGDANELQRQIGNIESRMARNPMMEFIDMGMFAGIVEDIDPQQDMYSYQSGLMTKYNEQYEKIPYAIRRTMEYAFVTPSTPMYQFLHSATQYSDFAAKYTIYKHLMSGKAGKTYTKAQAVHEAHNNFINYDVPTSPLMQYLNDMGIVMFTKYNLRIQKALFKLIAERPASAIGQAIAMSGIASLPPGIDPIVFNEYGNPFRTGAFALFSSWDEPFPIKALF